MEGRCTGPGRSRPRSGIGRGGGNALPALPTLPVLPALPALALLVLAGCEAGTDAPSSARIETRADGVVVVENGAGGGWADGEGWTLEEVHRIGAVTGDGPEVFGDVRSVALGPLGRAWIYDRQAQEIRVFDREGRYVRTVGGPGEGPGEFMQVTGLMAAPDGRLWAVDPGVARVSVFDSAGSFLTSHPWASQTFFSRWPATLDADGHFYDVIWRLSEGEQLLIRKDSLLRTLDTLRVPPHPAGPPTFTASSGTMTGSVSIPYAGTVEWAQTPDGGLWAAITDQYRLLRLGPNGDTLRVATRDFDPVPLGDLRDTMPLPRAADQQMPRSRLPRVKPAISRLLIDDEENVWVVRFEDRRDVPHPVDIFDADGVYRGSLAPPVDLDRHDVSFRDGELLTVATDSLGVEYVVRYRIVRGG